MRKIWRLSLLIVAAVFVFGAKSVMAATSSIDDCLHRKEYYFNEIHNVWVDGVYRCKVNSKGLLSKAGPFGISVEPADEEVCKDRHEGEILVNGDPSKGNARYWAERCFYLGTIGGAGPNGYIDYGTGAFITISRGNVPPGRNVPPTGAGGPIGGAGGGGTGSGTGSTALTRNEAKEMLENLWKKSGSASLPTDQDVDTFLNQMKNFTPVFTGPGVSIPSPSLLAKGISTEKNLMKLIVFYTNASLPFVSVVSIFVFVAAGLYYIFSFVDEELNAKAKKMMTYVVIGIIIIFSAYTIVNTLLRLGEFQS